MKILRGSADFRFFVFLNSAFFTLKIRVFNRKNRKMYDIAQDQKNRKVRYRPELKVQR